MRVGVLASGSGTILRAMLDRQLPDRGRAGRPSVRGARDRRRAPGSAPSSSSAPISADLRPGGLHEGSRAALERHDVDLVAIAGFGTILSESFVDAFGARAVNTHPALLPAFKGWHAVRDSARRGSEGHRLHRPPRHRRGRRRARSSPRRRYRCSTTTPRRPCTNASSRSSAGSSRRDRTLVREHRRGASTVNTKIERALLSVWDKTGLVDLARALHEHRRRARVVGRHRDGDRRRRDPGHHGARRHRRARDARPPGGDAAPEDPRRAARRPRQGIAPRRSRDARDPARSISSCRTSTRSSTGPTSTRSTSAARR